MAAIVLDQFRECFQHFALFQLVRHDRELPDLARTANENLEPDPQHELETVVWRPWFAAGYR